MRGQCRSGFGHARAGQSRKSELGRLIFDHAGQPGHLKRNGIVGRGRERGFSARAAR